jgi:threonyl-tRNA synthetase
MKIPYIAVVGEQEVANRTVNVNDRDGRQLDDMGVDDFLAMLLQENRPQADMPAAQTAGADCFRPPE